MELEKLKAENERLKREYDILDGIIDVNNAKIGQLEKVNKELAHYLACMTEQRNKANTILQEIKEIAEKLYEVCDDVYGDTRELLQDIINKAEV